MQMRKLWSVGEWQDDGEFAAKYCLSLSLRGQALNCNYAES